MAVADQVVTRKLQKQAENPRKIDPVAQAVPAVDVSAIQGAPDGNAPAVQAAPTAVVATVTDAGDPALDTTLVWSMVDWWATRVDMGAFLGAHPDFGRALEPLCAN